MKKGCLVLLLVLSTVTAVHAGHPRRYHIVHRPAVKVVQVPAKTGRVDINCNRKKADVYVNGTYVGVAGAYDGWPGKLHLRAGTHRIVIVADGVAVTKKVRVTAGREVDLNIEFK